MVVVVVVMVKAVELAEPVGVVGVGVVVQAAPQRFTPHPGCFTGELSSGPEVRPATIPAEHLFLGLARPQSVRNAKAVRGDVKKRPSCANLIAMAGKLTPL